MTGGRSGPGPERLLSAGMNTLAASSGGRALAVWILLPTTYAVASTWPSQMLHVDRVDEDHRVARIQRSALPFGQAVHPRSAIVLIVC